MAYIPFHIMRRVLSEETGFGWNGALNKFGLREGWCLTCGASMNSGHYPIHLQGHIFEGYRDLCNRS